MWEQVIMRISNDWLAVGVELGTVRLIDLTAGDVQGALEALAARLSSRTVQIAHNVLAERPLDALVFTGTESVTRDVEVLDSQQLIHAVPPALLTMVRLRGPDRLIGGTGQS
jgi:hypothetical protein